jgi:CheY-like chemotaxis protein
VLQGAIEATRPVIDANGPVITLTVPHEPLWAHADFTRLAQAFSNLLNNAVKYTAPASEIHVTASATNTTATLSVVDSGVGIPPEMLPRVFDMFTQLQPRRDRTHGGLGIGLALAKRLVELHGGTIEAQSEGPGLGSSFIIRLPIERTDDTADLSRVGADAADGGSCRVLVAEDNADAAEMMRVMLSFKRHDVRVAADGEQAVAIAEAFDPQIAFLDIGMPRMDGYEAARRIRDLLGPRVVLVALTGWGQDADKRQSREAGFDHHLTKPPEPGVLERLISECCTRGETRDTTA